MNIPKLDWMTGLLLASGVIVVGYVLLRETGFGQQILADSLLKNGEDVEDFKNAPNLDDRIRSRLPY